MVGAAIKVKISELGRSSLFLVTDAPGELMAAQTPELLRSLEGEGFEEDLSALIDAGPTTSQVVCLRMGFKTSEKLARALLDWCSGESVQPDWSFLISLEPH